MTNNVFKIKLIFALLFIFFGCQDLQRSNILDPHNPNSQRRRTVLVEAFVNDSGGNVIHSAIEALLMLRENYTTENFVLLEHHIQRTPGTDSLASEQSLSRYNDLVPQAPNQGLPHVFFDGSAASVQGASEAEIVYQRYRTELDKRRLLPAYFTIEAKAELSEEGQSIHVSADIARLGKKKANNVTARIAITEDIFHNGRLVVRALLPGQTLGAMEPGQLKYIDRDVALKSQWNRSDISIVICIQNSVTQENYHIAQLFL